MVALVLSLTVIMRQVHFVLSIFGLCAVKSLMMILSLWRRRKIWFYLFLQAIKKQIEEMKAYGIQSFERSFDKVSTKLLRFTKEGKELTVYE